MQFHKAERKKAKLRLAICGPSGSGKTLSALFIAKGLGGPVAMIDTESGSGELYADNPMLGMEYDVLQFDPPYTPQRAVEAVQAAQKAGYNVVIFDSLSHIWMGEGGMLEMVDNAAKGLQGNSFAAWKVVRPHEKKFLEALTRTDIHIIATMRTKTEWTTEKDPRTGKNRPVKVGLKPEQREGLEYEFTVVFDMAIDGNIATAGKDRTDMFKGDFFTPNEETGRKLLNWLERGKSLPPFDLDAVLFSIAAANSLDELKSIYDANKEPARAHGKGAELNSATTKRQAELKSMADAAQAGKLSSGQLKAIQAHYSKRGLERDDRLKDMSSFTGRDIESFNDLTPTEAHSFLEAISPDTEAGIHAQ